MVVDMVRFFTLPNCLIFNASMYSIVKSNGSTHLDWTELIQTKVNPDKNFTLLHFNLTIQGNEMYNESQNGLAKIEWTHSYQCIKKYMIRLRYHDTVRGEIKGEIVLSSPPHLKEKIEQDLHMIPGKHFRLTIQDV